jgi:hypothetical protein
MPRSQYALQQREGFAYIDEGPPDAEAPSSIHSGVL